MYLDVLGQRPLVLLGHGLRDLHCSRLPVLGEEPPRRFWDEPGNMKLSLNDVFWILFATHQEIWFILRLLNSVCSGLSQFLLLLKFPKVDVVSVKDFKTR